MKFERLAFDTNAAIALLRPERLTPPPFTEARALVMPLFVLAELELGRSRQTVKSADVLSKLVDVCTILMPDRDTITHYVAVRNEMLQGHTLPSSVEAREGLHHDMWIAALCIQHGLPLLSKDRDMQRVKDLKLVQW
ncbi:MAG TPA: PIN domain-containing protein [Thermoanaerobaculia bacterium]